MSYFPHDYGFGHAGFSPLMVATNATTKSFDAYSVTPHLGTELAMIGAHYYPGWTGKAPEDRVTGRFHYRRKAMEYARASVLLAKDPDIRAWALMFGGVVARSLDDVQWADWFYKRLASMRHPRAKVGGWFNGPVYEWFRDTYYNQERQAVPMRVPQRFTKEQLSRLAAPPPK